MSKDFNEIKEIVKQRRIWARGKIVAKLNQIRSGRKGLLGTDYLDRKNVKNKKEPKFVMMTFLYLYACYLFCVNRIMNLNTREIICQFPWSKAGFRVRIYLMLIRIQHFF
jgi:hypothetical protein